MLSHFFELLVELIEFLEPYLLITTIFFIPATIAITSLPKQFFKSEFIQNLLPNLYLAYERKRPALERANFITQMLMCIILAIDLFGLFEFFLGGEHGGGHGAGHGGEHGGEHETAGHGESEHNVTESEPVEH